MSSAKDEMKRAVSKEFRDFCLNKYPALKDKISYRKFFEYLCFSNCRNLETGLLVMPKDLLAGFVGDHIVEAKQHWNCEKQFILPFIKDVLPDFSYLEPQKKTVGWKEVYSCRQVIDRGFDDEMQKKLVKELLNDKKEVMFASGKKWNEAAKAFIRSENEEEHLEHEKTLQLNQSQKKIYDYMETISGKQFVVKLKENYGLIYSMIGLLDEEKQKIQCRILDSLREDSIIHYYPTERTSRLTANGDTVVGLKSTVRKKLCKGWTECDLRASQVSILAAKLEAPLTKALVMRNESIWESFHLHLFGTTIGITDEVKRVYKSIIYGIAFGTKKKMNNWARIFNKNLEAEVKAKNLIRKNRGQKEITNIKYIDPLDTRLERFSKELGKDFTKLLDHPIVEELLTAREKYQNKIRKQGGDYDVWGNIIAIDKSKNIMPRHIMAMVMQSYELEIISAVFDVANEFGKMYEFQIPIFQHDGMCISFHKPKLKKLVMKNIQKAVEEKAKSLGVHTTIEEKDL